MTTTGSGGEPAIAIVELARRNEAFRREIVTGDHSQVVVMTIPAGGEIGEEVHDVDQLLVFVEGEGRPLRLVTVYTPPEHPPGTVHRTKEEADAAGGDER
jgi:mannose-6-phosphate isomerase-like protein (cupin superfamily)